MEEQTALFENGLVAINKNKGGFLEVTFKRKPTESVRQKLKDSGFRWSPENKRWFAKDGEKTASAVEELKKLDKNDYIDYSVNKGKFNYSQQNAGKGGSYESDKGAGYKTGEGREPQRNDFGRSAEDDVHEHGERLRAEMGGVSGTGHSGNGHGDAVQQSERARVPSDNDSYSNGPVSGTVQATDGDAALRVRGGDVRTAEMAGNVSKPDGGSEQPRHGHVDDQNEIFLSAKTFEGRYNYTKQRFEMLFKRKLNPQYMELLKYYGYKWDKESGLFCAPADADAQKGMQMITESELAIDAGVDPIDLSDSPADAENTNENTRKLTPKEEDSETLLAAFAPDEKVMEEKDSDVIVSDFAEKDLRAPARYRGVFRKDGYAFAGNGKIVAKLREGYPQSLEGKLTASDSSDVLGQNWLDLSSMGLDEKSIAEKTETTGETEGLAVYLKRAIAADALDDGHGAAVQIGGLWIPAKEARTAIAAAIQHGLDKISLSGSEENEGKPRAKALVFGRDKDGSFVAVHAKSYEMIKDSAILVDSDGVFHNYENNPKAAEAIFGKEGYAEGFAARLSGMRREDARPLFLSSLSAARKTMEANKGGEFPKNERDCEFLAAMAVFTKAATKDAKDAEKSQVMRRIWEKQDELMHAFENPASVLDEKKRTELVDSVLAERRNEEEVEQKETDRQAKPEQAGKPSIFDSNEYKSLAKQFADDERTRSAFSARYQKPELPGGKRLNLSESDRLEWAMVMAKKDLAAAPAKEPEVEVESQNEGAPWKAVVKTEGKTTTIELGEDGKTVGSDEMIAHVMSAIMKSAIKKNLRMMNPAWGEKQIDDEYKAAVAEDGEEEAFRLSLKSMKNLSAARMKTAETLAGSEALEAAKELMPESQFGDVQKDLAVQMSREAAAEIQRVGFLASALRKNAGSPVSEDTGLHDKGFVRYEAESGEWFVYGISGSKAFAFAVENGDEQSAEFKEMELSDILSRSGCRLDLDCDPYTPLEIAVHERHPSIFEKESAPYMAKLPVPVTKENLQSLGLKEGSVLRDSDGRLWKIMNAGAMAKMKPLDDSPGSTVKSVFSGGLETLLGLSYSGGPTYEAFPAKEKEKPEQGAGVETPESLADEASGVGHRKDAAPSSAKETRQLARQILSDHTNDEIRADPKMMEILSMYEGGGGIAGEEGRTGNEVLNAFYTPRPLVSAMWSLADLYAPESLRVLEPSSGIGRFAEGREDKKFTLREIDKTSARIARILHPEAEVVQGAFEAQFFDKEGAARLKDYKMPKYDLVIGNPPYGEFLSEWKGKGEGEAHKRYEEYFIEKALDSLENENGAVVFVVPSGWLRSGRDGVKELIASKGKLVDAYRLPNGTFDTTDVGTDIVVLKKLSYAESVAVKATLKADAANEENDKMSASDKAAARAIIESLSSDAFFKAHPDKVLGVEDTRSGRFGPEPYVRLADGKTVESTLSDLKAQTEQKIDALFPERTKVIESAPIVQEEKESAAENKASGGKADRALADAMRAEAERERDETALALCTERSAVPFEDKDLEKINDMKGFVWDLETVYDVSTKTGYIVNGIRFFPKVVAITRPDGRIEKKYSEASKEFKSLTKAKQAALTDGIEKRCAEIREDMSRLVAFDEKEQSAVFLGHKNPDIQTFRAGSRYVVDSSKPKAVNLKYYHFADFMDEVPERDMEYEYPSQQAHANGNVNSVFFARIDKVLQDGAANSRAPILDYAQMKEDDAVVRLDSDEVQVPPDKGLDDYFEDLGIGREKRYESESWDKVWEKKREYDENRERKITERWEKARERCAQMNGFASPEDFRKACEKFLVDTQKSMEITRQEEEQRQTEYEDADILLSELLENLGSKTGETKQIAGRSVSFSQGKNRKGDVDITVDGELSLRLNADERTVDAVNGFRITPAFLAALKEKWGGWPEVADVEDSAPRISLKEIISKRKIPAQKTQEGMKAMELFLKNAKADAALSESESRAEFAAGGKTVYEAIAEEGSIRRLKAKDSNYDICVFDAQNGILTICQEAYERSLVEGLESEFRSRFEGKAVSVVTDVTIDGRRYVDTDGATCCVPAAPSRYQPQKEKILNAAEFARMYGKELDENKRAFIAATDRNGAVVEDRLTLQQRMALEECPDYTKTKIGYVHVERYASGNIYRKLDELEADYREGTGTKEDYERNRALLEAALPPRRGVDEINVPVISPFVQELELGGEPALKLFLEWATGCNLEASPNRIDEIVDFTLSGINREDVPESVEWKDVVDYAIGEPLPAINEPALDETQKAALRNRRIDDRKAAAETLWLRFVRTQLSEEQQKEFEDKYNRKFNAERKPDYSKLPLFLSGMNMYRKGKEFKFYDQQIKGIAQCADKGNSIIAYPVGMGKTATGIGVIETQLQSGRAKRPLVIVPKSVIGKWEQDIHELFPGRQVVNLGNFSKDSTGAYYSPDDHGLSIPAGAVTLATRDALNNIHWDRQTVDKYLFDDYADLLSVNDQLEDKNARTRETAKARVYAAAGGSNKVRDEYYVEWKNAAFDMLVVDEAHAFKNLFKVPRRNKKGKTQAEGKNAKKANEFSGLGQGDPSKRALKMFNMTQIIQKQNEDRNVFLLSATPFTNSPLEVYSMLTYVARKEMEEAGIKDLYDFCAQYAKTRWEPVVKTNGVEYGNVMKEFADVQGLREILRKYIDKVDYDEAGIIRPILKTHKIFLEPTDLQRRIFDFATDVIMTYQPKEGEKRAPVLEAISLMKTAALSPALVSPNALVDPNTKKRTIEIPPIEQVVECSPKLKLVCDTIVKNWNAHPECGQIMYMPEGTDAFRHVIDYMKKQGVPEGVFMTIDGQSEKIGGKQIKISKDDDADDKRQKASDIFNDEKSPAKILIGSQAICEGMDLNGNTIALYNCQLGWNPSEMTQLNGRIQRPGNLQGHCHVVVPLVADSSDPAFFQKHDEKSHRFFDLFNYDGEAMDVEDINPEQLKYELIKDPLKLARMEQSETKERISREESVLKGRTADFERLIKNKARIKEELDERKSGLADYISRHKESVLSGKPNRSEEEQAEGEERFRKSIAGFEKQLSNVVRRLEALGVTDERTQEAFVGTIESQMKEKAAEYAEADSPSFVQKLMEKHEKIIRDQRDEWKRDADERPLYKRIQDDMVPMHVVEYDIRKARYKEELQKAEGDAYRQKEIEEAWKSYVKKYNEKWGGAELKAREKAAEAPAPKAESADSIVRIIDHQIEEIEWKRSAEGPQETLFPMVDEPENVRAAKNSPAVDWANSTVDNFSDNLKAVFDDPSQEATVEAVLKVTKKLIDNMKPADQAKFVKITSQLGIKSQKDTNDFFVKIAKGELRLTPGKKPPVVKVGKKDYEYDIF